MPIVPSFIERLILLQLNQGPGPMLDFLGAQAFRAACVAQRLGIFEALSNGPLTAAQVAHQIEADERGTTLLMEALEALGYLKKKNARYANTSMTAKWLPALADGLPFFERVVFEQWGYLEESIRSGEPPVDLYEQFDREPGRWREFQAGMVAIARMAADDVVAKVKLPATARRLLDVGGGHGLYSIKFCRRYPQLSATVFDWPQALEVAREVITAEGMGDRVSVQEGDFWIDELGNGYDVALLFNIVHAYLPDKNTELVRKVAGALNPGGLIVILDQLTGKALGPTAKAMSRLQGLTLFNATGGQSYAFEEIGGWLTNAGFTKPRRINLLKSPGNGLVLGTKTAQASV